MLGFQSLSLCPRSVQVLCLRLPHRSILGLSKQSIHLHIFILSLAEKITCPVLFHCNVNIDPITVSATLTVLASTSIINRAIEPCLKVLRQLCLALIFCSQAAWPVCQVTLLIQSGPRSDPRFGNSDSRIVQDPVLDHPQESEHFFLINNPAQD